MHARSVDLGSFCVQRFLLWERRNNTVQPFNETVQQVFARISALRDSLDGPQVKPPSYKLIASTNTCCWTHLFLAAGLFALY